MSDPDDTTGAEQRANPAAPAGLLPGRDGERACGRTDEQVHRASDQLFRLFVSSVRDYAIFMLDPTGRIMSWNAGAERLKGWRAEEIVGQHFSRFYARDEVEAGKPAYELEVAAAVGRFEDEGWRIRKDGSRFWANVIITAVHDEARRLVGFAKVTRDLTARKQAEEHARQLAAEQAARVEAERAERTLRYLAEVSEVLSSSLDYEVTFGSLARLLVPALADWCVVHMLDAGEIRAVAVAHVDPAKVELARDLQRRYPPDPRAPRGVPRVLETGEPELHEEIPEGLLEILARDAEHLTILRALGLRSAMVVPLVARGQTIGAMTLIAAESQRRYGEWDLALAREIGRRAGIAADNARLYREARDAIAFRDAFLSIASHELKTPLAALQLQIQSLGRALVRQPGVAENVCVNDRLARTEASVGRLGRLVNELLDVSRIRAGRLELQLDDVDVAALAAEVIERFAEEAASAGCALDLRHEGPVVARCDRARIDQVLTNMLTNALKYAPGKPVQVSVMRTDEVAVLTVRDQGIGVEPEHQGRIFDRFERAVSERNYGGFGLGLWIAREIMGAHGGSIAIQSEPGRGATFRVELPLPSRSETAG